jgi:hypothetical protein
MRIESRRSAIVSAIRLQMPSLRSACRSNRYAQPLIEFAEFAVIWCHPRAKLCDSMWLSASGGRMVKCTRRPIRQLKTALHWKMPEAQRRAFRGYCCVKAGCAAGNCGCNGDFAEHCEPGAHGLRPGIKALKPKASGGRKRGAAQQLRCSPMARPLLGRTLARRPYGRVVNVVNGYRRHSSSSMP